MKIHYVSPFSTEKNIGKAINHGIKDLHYCQDDWIIHCDHDTLWLLPDSKAQVERILSETGCDVLGCMTNRLRSPEQLIGGVFNDDDRIREHIRIATECREKFGDEVKTANIVAACMMAFKVSVWEQVGGFQEGILNFDAVFCHSVRSLGFKIGIMQGVYIYHLYRSWSKNPIMETKHLIK
jgi:hypothetical protein